MDAGSDEALRMFVLDCLADDIESVETILSLLNKPGADGYVREWGRPFDEDEVVAALALLVGEGMAEVLAPIGPQGELERTGRGIPAEAERRQMLWFEMTRYGRAVHTRWIASE